MPDNFTADRQAKPGTLRFIGQGITDLAEFFEDQLLIFAGRVTLAHQTVNAAAAEAARTATIARTPTDADTRARQAAQAMLTEQNTVCAGTEISIDTSGFARPIGTPAQVTVTVTCYTQLADLTQPVQITKK